MSTATPQDFDTLCQSARDLARSVAGLIEELRGLHSHATPEPHAHPDPADRQLARVRDQITLLAATVEDIGRLQKSE